MESKIIYTQIFKNSCMNRFIVLIMLILCAGLYSVSAQETSVISILVPEDGVTYGPWSDTYFFYPRSQSDAHHIRISVDMDEEVVSYYGLFRNGVHIADFDSTDKEPSDLVGYLTTYNNLTVVAYDDEDNELGRDDVEFYLAVNLDDYFELIESEPEFLSEFSVTDEDLGKINVTRELYQETTKYFTVTKKIMYVNVSNKFTNDMEEHTRVTINIKPSIQGEEVSVYNLIPKYIVEHVNDMTLTEEFKVLDNDPLMMWHFGDVEEITYDVNEKLTEEQLEEIKTIAVTEQLPEKSAFFYFIPLLLIPIIVGAIVYFGRFKKE